ncbi:hypothetical protein FRX31_009336 [Thalictrum thalictroides]|uniref:Uncharacterized protein n=1 Tax=Thalictrum thalictroides TaxID=46969 RepID=A0A7J6WUH5_THATH|nr:hypothetical protein FRX31_009336 [Thalictrum thalictroides]
MSSRRLHLTRFPLRFFHYRCLETLQHLDQQHSSKLCFSSRSFSSVVAACGITYTGILANHKASFVKSSIKPYGCRFSSVSDPHVQTKKQNLTDNTSKEEEEESENEWPCEFESIQVVAHLPEDGHAYYERNMELDVSVVDKADQCRSNYSIQAYSGLHTFDCYCKTTPKMSCRAIQSFLKARGVDMSLEIFLRDYLREDLIPNIEDGY